MLSIFRMFRTEVLLFECPPYETTIRVVDFDMILTESKLHAKPHSY